MKPMESLVSLATAVVVAGDDMKSQLWCTPTAGGGRPFAYSAICGRVSMLKSRSRFSLPRFALDGFAMRVVKRGTCAAAAGKKTDPGLPDQPGAKPADRACGRSCSP